MCSIKTTASFEKEQCAEQLTEVKTIAVKKNEMNNWLRMMVFEQINYCVYVSVFEFLCLKFLFRKLWD